MLNEIKKKTFDIFLYNTDKWKIMKIITRRSIFGENPHKNIHTYNFWQNDSSKCEENAKFGPSFIFISKTCTQVSLNILYLDKNVHGTRKTFEQNKKMYKKCLGNFLIN